ncbi:MAG: acyl-ACP--UDP-N-acetylglucosamine O-acyltransferase [Holosporales bacterium]|jgi:UDP-N-acetylglucosamine acyltransferase|nr:acyl-ACP--UDP-N-acetylglucosamine O-acyltransferase [Holosporales bacterium]
MISKSATIHPTAIIAEGAIVKDGCFIGPYCCVGENVILNENVRLESHVVISGNTSVGFGVTIYPFASLGQKPQDLKYDNEKSNLEIGKNTVIREYVTANIGTKGGGMLTKIGDNCLIMAYCHVAHDCMIGNNVILTNGVNLSGHVNIGDFAIIGGMSVVKQFVRIGKRAIIGGYSGIDRDVIPYALARSDRNATIRGLNIIGLKRNGFDIDIIKEMLDAYSDIFSIKNSGSQLIERIELAKEKYIDNKYVMEIIEFIKEKSKNPLCTEIPTDESQ